MWNGNLAPEEGEWNDILFDIPYVRNTTNDLIVEFCFDNCDWNEKSLNKVQRLNGIQSISVHMFNEMIGAARKNIQL